MNNLVDINKKISINDFYNLIDKCIINIKKIDNKYKFLVIKDKKNVGFYYLEKYYNNEMKNKIYNTIDNLYMYLKGIKETLQDITSDEK